MTLIMGWQLPNSELSALVRAMPVHSWITKACPLFYLCAVTVVAALVLGGGTRGGFLSDAVLQLLAIPLLLVSLWKLFGLPWTRQARLAFWFCLTIALVPLAQLIPLPPWLWTALPNRQPSAEAFEIIGRALPWMPISVSPQATWLSALSLVPPTAIFFGTVLLNYRERRYLSLVIVVVAVVSVFLGLIQLAQGQRSPFRFFEITNPEDAVGFFANKNHFAALLYCLIPFVAAWTLNKMTGGASDKSKEQPLPYDLSSIIAATVGFTTLVIIFAGEITTRSRAGLGLAMVALVGAMALRFSNRRASSWLTPNKIMVAAVAVAVVFSLQFGFYRMLGRVSDWSQGSRPAIALTTIEAARAYMPIGAGLGTFVPVYSMFEKPEQVTLFYVNRAHNDILELWLETGVLGPLLMGLFAFWLVRRTLEIWRNEPPDGASSLDWSLARAGTIVVALLIAHSVFDYPLRTAAMMTIMAVCCALLIDPLGGGDEAGALESAIPLRNSPALPPRGSASSLPELQAALLRIGQSDSQRRESEPLAPHRSASLPLNLSPIKSPEELQAAVNRIGQVNPPSRPTPPQGTAGESDIPPLGLDQSALSTPLSTSSIPPEQRWGVSIAWPDAWSKTSTKDSK